jgi:hypothetical protein
MIDVRFAGKAVFEMSVPETPREVQLAIDSILASPLQDQPSPGDHVLQLGAVVQVMGDRKVFQVPLLVNSYQLAVS